MFLVDWTVDGAFAAAFLVVVRHVSKVLFMGYAIKDMADYLFERPVAVLYLFYFVRRQP